jgi:uncharacterized protein (DUF1697 family)
MKRHVALLRGINVGKAKRVAMGELRETMQGLGYENVRTLLNSGNAVFDAGAGTPAAHARKLRAAVLARHLVEAEVIVKTAAELSAALAEHPGGWQGAEEPRLLVMFVQDDADLAKLAAVEQADWSPDAIAVGRHAAWLWCATGIAKSAMLTAVGKALGPVGTARNRATLARLEAMVRER